MPQPFPHRRASGNCGLHRKYSLTCDDYDALGKRSRGLCEFCGADKPLVIDHDHRYGTSAVRGLVCYRCNMYLGRFDTVLRFWAKRSRRSLRAFDAYSARAWFARALGGEWQDQGSVTADSVQIWSDLHDYRAILWAVSSLGQNSIAVDLDKPADIARTLRERMSPQGFAVLVRFIDELRSQPKQ